MTCLDAPTGKKLWREKVGGKFFGSPVRVRDRLVLHFARGRSRRVGRRGPVQALARILLGEPSQSTPAVAGGVMYFRTQSQLIAVGQGRGGGG